MSMMSIFGNAVIIRAVFSGDEVDALKFFIHSILAEVASGLKSVVHS